LEESFAPGVELTVLAASYGIPVQQLYQWRYEQKRQESSTKEDGHFVELRPSGSRLQQISLSFEDRRVEVHGHLSGACLLKRIDLLESPCST
jgi:transposase-like protein